MGKNRIAEYHEKDILNGSNNDFAIFQNSYNNKSIAKLHWHEYPEIMHITEGFVTIIVNKVIYHAGPGDILFIKPYQMHSGYSSRNVTVKYNAIIFSSSIIDSIIAKTRNTDNYKSLLKKFIKDDSDYYALIDKSVPHYKDLNYCIENILSENNTKDPFYKMQIENYITSFMVSMCRNIRHCDYQKKLNETSETTNRIQDLISYIYATCPTSMSVEEAAEFVNFSPYYFCKVFKKNTGYTFITFLTIFKLNKAEDLLSYTGDPISLIADDLGFCSINYFDKVFKKVKGCSPSTYRKEYRQVSN